MAVFKLILVASAAGPLGLAWHMNRGRTIRHALAWTWSAWAAWLAFAWSPSDVSAFAALTFTAATGVAVLGARRPVVGPWNFIVASLLVVLWIGWAEGLLDGSGLKLGAFRLTFVSGLLIVGLGNYLPTRLMAAALMLGTACAVIVADLAAGKSIGISASISPALAGLAPWAGAICVFSRRSTAARSHPWSVFRTRYGIVWAMRLAEQFNAVAAHRRWPVRLRWRGLRAESQIIEDEWESAVVALMKRFQTDIELEPELSR